MPGRRRLVAAVALLSLGLLLMASQQVQGVRRDVNQLESHLGALSQITTGDHGALAAQMRHGLSELNALDHAALDVEADLGPAERLLEFARPIPVVGGDIAALPHLLAMVHHGERMAKDLEPIASSLVVEGAPGAGSFRLEALARSLSGDEAALTAAETELDGLSWERGQIDEASVSPRIEHYLALLDRALTIAHDGLKAAPLVGQSLGVHGARRYLLIFQNGDEIRSTGGYISSAGLATMEGGAITSVNLVDSASLTDFAKPNPVPPAALVKHANTGVWIFRDSNWSPDFPTAARAMEFLYDAQTGIRTDGVIAVDATAVGKLLDLVGGVELNEYHVRVRSDNMLPLARQFYRYPLATNNDAAPRESFVHRKDFTGEVFEAFLAQAQTGTPDLAAWARSILPLMREGHLLVFMNDPGAEEILKLYELDGGIHAYPGEYMQWVDSNIGYNKVDASVVRSLSIQVVITAGLRSRIAATMTYTNTSPTNGAECLRERRYAEYEKLVSDCAWEYARLYVTNGADFVSAIGQGPPELQPPEGEAQAPGFGSFVIIPRGSVRNLTFEYLGREMEGGSFRLYLRKQAGLGSLPILLRLEFPAAWKFIRASPKPTSTEAGVVMFKLNLAEGQEFDVRFDAHN